MRPRTFYIVMVSFLLLFFSIMVIIYLYSITVYNNRTLTISAALMVSNIFALFVSSGFFLCGKEEIG